MTWSGKLTISALKEFKSYQKGRVGKIQDSYKKQGVSLIFILMLSSVIFECLVCVCVCVLSLFSISPLHQEVLSLTASNQQIYNFYKSNF